MPFIMPSFFNIRPKAKWCSFCAGRQSIVGILGQRLLGKSSFLTSSNAYIIASAIQYSWLCVVILLPLLIECANIV